jgi:hydroxypyruvate isomerase
MNADCRLAANCSMLFTELDLHSRPAAAKAAGFDAVEFWWPWPEAVPEDRDVDAFVAAIRDAGVALIGLNFFAGDLAGADCGAASDPQLAAQFRDNVPVVVGIGEQLGTQAFNALYGNRIRGMSALTQDEVAMESLALAAAAADRIGATVLIEAVSGPKPYPLRTAADAVAVVDRLHEHGHPNTAFLLDIYHLATNGDDVDGAIAAHHGAVGHVQVADAPGRGEPGSGDLDLPRYVDALAGVGYRGYLAMEYKPSTPNTVDSLGWMGAAR